MLRPRSQLEVGQGWALLCCLQRVPAAGARAPSRRLVRRAQVADNFGGNQFQGGSQGGGGSNSGSVTGSELGSERWSPDIDYQSIFADATVPMCITRVDGKVIECNRAFEVRSRERARPLQYRYTTELRHSRARPMPRC